MLLSIGLLVIAVIVLVLYFASEPDPCARVEWTRNAVPRGEFPPTAVAIVPFGDRERLFLAGGPDQNDVLLQYVDGAIVVAEEVPNNGHRTYSAVYAFGQLILGRHGGIYTQSVQSVQSAPEKIYDLPESVIATALLLIDYDNSGSPSIFVATCGGAPKNLLLKLKDGKYHDVAEAAGLDDAVDTWDAALINGGGIATGIATANEGYAILYNNLGGGTFTKFADTKIGSWRGVAVGDATGDGIADLIFTSNTSNHALWRGNIDGTFTIDHDSLKSRGHGRGVITHDYNRDKLSDVIIATDPGRWLPQFMRTPGEVHLSKGRGLPLFVKDERPYNPNRGIRPILWNFAGTGPRLAWVNIDDPVVRLPLLTIPTVSE